ncbi:MAG: DUF6249 domain-containing protein [Ignavibacteriaceae bacterium]|nr:DUF6249 domain-containing protein [Ignavibacteriaceae bacterium]
MDERIVAVFIPIIITLVAGLVFVTFIYFRSREKQMLIEKGMDAETIKSFYENKKDNYLMLKIGVISIAFGLGLGLGLMLEDWSGKDYWVPFFIFSFTGVGFVIGNLTAHRLEKKNISA